MKAVSIVEISRTIVFTVFSILFRHLVAGWFLLLKSQTKRKAIPENFRLKPLDIECMKALHHKVNIVPIIAKADALTREELGQMKQNVRIFPRENSFLNNVLFCFRFSSKSVSIKFKSIKFPNVIRMKMKISKSKIVN